MPYGRQASFGFLWHFINKRTLNGAWAEQRLKLIWDFAAHKPPSSVAKTPSLNFQHNDGKLCRHGRSSSDFPILRWLLSLWESQIIPPLVVMRRNQGSKPFHCKRFDPTLVPSTGRRRLFQTRSDICRMVQPSLIQFHFSMRCGADRAHLASC
jgi:hypothetical protein